MRLRRYMPVVRRVVSSRARPTRSENVPRRRMARLKKATPTERNTMEIQKNMLLSSNRERRPENSRTRISANEVKRESFTEKEEFLVDANASHGFYFLLLLYDSRKDCCYKEYGKERNYDDFLQSLLFMVVFFLEERLGNQRCHRAFPKPPRLPASG